jgi:hypothetical protein|tara:strand:+ start:528 stop:731 length:204 start_codon:yes stop_codon:yes gene_type:complete
MENKITENKNPSDKVLPIQTLNLILQHMVKLPYKDSAMVIQTLTTLQDVDNNNVNKVNTNTITKDKA